MGLEPVVRSEISGRAVACRARAPFSALAAFSFWTVTASADLMKARLTCRQSPAQPPTVAPLARTQDLRMSLEDGSRWLAWRRGPLARLDTISRRVNLPAKTVRGRMTYQANRPFSPSEVVTLSSNPVCHFSDRHAGRTSKVGSIRCCSWPICCHNGLLP